MLKQILAGLFKSVWCISNHDCYPHFQISAFNKAGFSSNSTQVVIPASEPRPKRQLLIWTRQYVAKLDYDLKVCLFALHLHRTTFPPLLYTALHYTTLHYAPLHCTTLHRTESGFNENALNCSDYTALHCTLFEEQKLIHL